MKTAAIIWGVVFLLLGFLGMMPGVAPNGMLFGIFRVDGMQNAIHLLTGIFALFAGLSSPHASRVYFETVGVIYALLAFLGFFYGSRNLMGLMAHNMADTWLHAVIAVVSLYLGYVWRKGAFQVQSVPTGRM